jgi:hypothetical protein
VRRAAERAEQARQREAQARAAARAAHLDRFADHVDELSEHVEALVATKRPTEYDRAIPVLRDLNDIADRHHHQTEFAHRLESFLMQHSKKPSFMQRLERAGLLPPQSNATRFAPGNGGM